MDISVFTLGCKTNLYESGQIIAELQKQGHNAFHGLKRADVFVLNTCAITAEAEKKSRQLVSRARKLNPDCRIAVVGCAAQKNAAQFARTANVTLIKGVAGKEKIARQIAECGVDVEEIPSVFLHGVNASQERTRAFVKIQDGCDNFCSYCVVPYLRGRSRSRKIADVADEIKNVSAPETVLIGIDISQYGRDNGETLGGLFRALEGTPTRFRLGSLEAGVVTDELLDSLKNVDFCPHFHLSLQSGSDGVLKRMNRKYDTLTYAAAVDRILSAFSDAAITTDIIVGFCGETEKEFSETEVFAEKIGFADIHVFPYSAREGTAAYGHDDVASDVKAERAARLGEIKRKLKLDFSRKHIGTVQSVLCEQKRGTVWEGYAPDYLRVRFTGSAQSGRIVKVLITAADENGAEGEVL